MSNLHFDELDDKTIKLMHEAGITPVKAAYGFNAAINRLIAVVRVDEREACAALATQKAKHIFDQAEIYAVGASETANAQATAWQLKGLADEIRARSK